MNISRRKLILGTLTTALVATTLPVGIKQVFASSTNEISFRRFMIQLKEHIMKGQDIFLFEHNDEHTRHRVKEYILGFLNHHTYVHTLNPKSLVYENQIICDETNNPSSLIDKNGFLCTIYMKPTMATTYVKLDFGVDYDSMWENDINT
jgi:hypothetical protein